MGTGGIWEINAWTLIKAGGPIMIPIILCSVFAVAIVIEKFMYFASIQTNIALFKKQVFESIKNNHIKAAIELCEKNPSPLAAIFKAGLEKFGSPRESIKETMEGASLVEIPLLEKKLNTLATIAHVSPLLGLLGTAAGLMNCFYTIQTRSAALNPITPGDLSGGITQALITTIAGLMVAIPAYVAYNYFVSRVDDIILEMERGATELINFMSDIIENRGSEKGLS